MFTAEQLQGARSLICDGLKLSEDDNLLLLYQSDLTNVADCITEAASGIGVNIDRREFARDDFVGGYPETFYPDNLTKFTSPRGIALVIEWSEATTEGRLELLRRLQNYAEEWHIASMPGVDLEGLASCNADFVAIRNYSLIAFAVVARSRVAVLQTPNPEGALDELRIPIGSYLPILSTGEIPPKTWGNFPSGETYVVPNPYKASGTVTIRGSLPERPLEENEWVRCEIKRGRISFGSIRASSIELETYFKALFFIPSGRPKCRNANALAELGIGTNPSIVRLTGKPIFDEKKLGTVHIAFGRNTQFNGPLESCVHHDIVCTEPTLTLQSKYNAYELVQAGTFAMTKEEAQPQLETFPAFERMRVRLTSGKLQPDLQMEDEKAVAVCIKYVPTGRAPVFKIGGAAEAAQVSKMLALVQNAGSITISDLINTPNCANQKDECRRLIAGMLEYGLLKEDSYG